MSLLLIFQSPAVVTIPASAPAILTDWTKYLQDYRGYIQFPAVVDNQNNLTYPPVTIPLFIKEYPIPVRKPKITEVATLPMIEPDTGWETQGNWIFYGSNDPLQTQMTGFLITPITSDANGQWHWNPTTDGTNTGTSLGLTGYSNVDVINAYIEGRMSITSTGRWKRVDPAVFVDPYGHQYNNPVIAAWAPSYTVTPRVQQFQMTLYLAPADS